MKILTVMLKGLFIQILFLLPLTLPAQTRGIVWEYQIVTAFTRSAAENKDDLALRGSSLSTGM